MNAKSLIESAKSARSGEALRSIKADAKRFIQDEKEMAKVMRAIARQARKFGIEGQF